MDPLEVSKEAANSGTPWGVIGVAVGGAITTVGGGIAAWLKGRAGASQAVADEIKALRAELQPMREDIGRCLAAAGELRTQQAAHAARDESEKEEIKRSIVAQGEEVRRVLDIHVNALGDRIDDVRAFVTSARRES